MTDVDHPQAGLLLDIWHIFRSGIDYATMAGLVPADKLFVVELNDGAREQVGTGLEDTFDNRMLCGQGDFDVAGFIDAVRRIGYPGPWGVEIMSHRHRALDPETALSKAFRTVADCLTANRAQAGRIS